LQTWLQHCYQQLTNLEKQLQKKIFSTSHDGGPINNCGSLHEKWRPWTMPILYLDIHGCIQESMWAYQDWVFGVIEPHPPNKLIIHLGLNCDDKCYIIWCVGWRVYVVGSKWHITSQCVYFAFRIIVHFGVFFFFPKTCFPQEEFSNEMFWNFFFIVFIVVPIYIYILQSNLEKYEFLKVHRFCQILCFVLNFFHNVKSYQNMLTFSSFIFNVISYKFSLNNIYIASHLHVKKDTWIFFKP
jgi:hypothetical protein